MNPPGFRANSVSRSPQTQLPPAQLTVHKTTKNTHWAYQSLNRPAVPRVQNATWCRNPIDRFILARLETEKLSPAPIASQEVRLRRLHYRVTGLPPQPALTARHHDDRSPAAWSRLVNELLNSPDYGIHQGRIWLDLVRYADTDGYEKDAYRPLAWRYRDYVIDAFNRDLPFDQFLREQLAGDEMTRQPFTEEDQRRFIATGYLRAGSWDETQAVFLENNRGRDQLLTDLVNTTASAFLGLTFNCCRCHDHKTEPFSQEDHFRLRAFFAGVKFQDDLIIDTQNEQTHKQQYNQIWDRKIAVQQTGLDRMIASGRNKLRRARLDILPPRIQQLLDLPAQQLTIEEEELLAPYRELLKFSNSDCIAALSEAERKRCQALRVKIREYNTYREPYQRAMGVNETARPPRTFLLEQGDFRQPGEVVPSWFAGSVQHIRKRDG